MRIIAALSKGGRGAVLSHLDIQRTLQRAMRRADIPLRYSKGFNPHPELHFATALPTGARGMWEWFDVELEEPMDTEDFVQALNGQLPEGLSVHDAFEGPDQGFGSLAAHLRCAGYTLSLWGDTDLPALQEGLARLLAGTEWIVDKRTKGGIKPQNIRPQIYSAGMEAGDSVPFRMQVVGELTAAGGLRPEALVRVLSEIIGTPLSFESLRTGLFFDGFLGLPILEKEEK